MDLWKRLGETSRPIVLYGMGNGAELVIKQLSQINKKPSGIFASDDFVRGQQFCGFTVQKYDDLVQCYPDMIILVCFGSNRPEVMKKIKELSQKHQVYCPDVPVYGETVFTEAFLKENYTKLQCVYNMLADECSKKTFKNIIRFKLSGETLFLEECQSEEELFEPLSLTNEEVYADFGAYRGDTVKKFAKSVTDYRKIIAVEPNEKTHKKLMENTTEYHDVILHNAAVSDFDGVEEFASAGRGSAIGKKGKTVSVYKPDTLLQNEQVTLVKMDVEGQELRALHGMTRTIQVMKPKMIIAAYHRTEDLFAIPLFVMEQNPTYKLYLRHSPHNLAWDSNFYFV